jgi:Cu/Ag efflux protein CusF
MKCITAILFGLALIPAMPALAGQYGHDGQPMGQGQHTGKAWSDGIVKKISQDNAKVTIAHGPLLNLEMPAMTMAFRVKDPAWLKQMKPGDRIRFVAEEVNGVLTVTELQSVR